MEDKKLKGEIVLKSLTPNDMYTQYVYDAFDIQTTEHTEVRIPYDISQIDSFDWNIGVIYGSSGSGKTTILKSLGALSKCNFDNSMPLISNFDWMEPSDVTKLFTSIGLSSVPSWLRPFALLSNGEQHRAEVAFKIATAPRGKIILIDEFTSVVNRDVAKAMSFAMQKYARKNKLKIIVASVHYDIFEWLMPDWSCSPQNGGVLERHDYLRLGRPSIELQVSRVQASVWDMFKKHHYMTEEFNPSFHLLLFEWGVNPVAICAYSPLPSGTLKNAFRLTRTVVLPDFQGIGIGKGVSNFTSAVLKAKGGRVFTKTVNPALGEYRNVSSSEWRQTSKNGRKRRDVNGSVSRYAEGSWTPLERASYCHEYVGDALEGYEELLTKAKELKTVLNN